MTTKINARETRKYNKVYYFTYDYGAPIKSFKALHEYVKCTGKLK